MDQKNDNKTLRHVLDELIKLKNIYEPVKDQTADLMDSILVAVDIIKHYHLAFWEYGRVDDVYYCERCGHSIDMYGWPEKDIPDRCPCCRNYMHEKTRPRPADWPELYAPQGFTFDVEKIERMEDE